MGQSVLERSQYSKGSTLKRLGKIHYVSLCLSFVYTCKHREGEMEKKGFFLILWSK